MGGPKKKSGRTASSGVPLRGQRSAESIGVPMRKQKSTISLRSPSNVSVSKSRKAPSPERPRLRSQSTQLLPTAGGRGETSLRDELLTDYRSPQALPLAAWAAAVAKGGAKSLAKDFYDLKKMDLVKPSPIPQLHRTEDVFRLNKLRSRYEDVGCWDQTRVKLANPAQDFIHANFVDGLDEPRKFIVTQGPLELTMGDKGEKEFEDTIKDFWAMVWERRVVLVVMLCLLEEDGRNKCAEYWPAQKKDRFIFGNFAITCTETEEKRLGDQVVVESKLVLQKRGVKAKRELTHLHHQSWPDRASAGAEPLFAFLDLIEAHRRVGQEGRALAAPVVVHCSAGIGRSGTLVALDIVVALVKNAAALDVFFVIRRLRQSRRFAVQTMDQYLGIYVALLGFLLSSKRIPSAVFNLAAFVTDVQAFLARSEDY